MSPTTELRRVKRYAAILRLRGVIRLRLLTQQQFPKKMVDKTELPKMNESVADADFDNDSEYEIAEYPPLRKIDPKAQPLPSALKKGSKKKKPTVQFESEPFFFDCCRNGEIDHVKRLIKDKMFFLPSSFPSLRRFN